VLRQSRKKTALALFGSAVFVALGVWMITDSSTDSSRYSPEIVVLIGWCAVLLFGAFGLKGLYNLARPMQVVLSPEGFQVLGLRRLPPVRWQDVERFFMGQVKRSKFICYDLKAETMSNFQRAMDMVRPGQWGDGQLPGALEMKPDDVLQLFDDWHRRYGA